MSQAIQTAPFRHLDRHVEIARAVDVKRRFVADFGIDFGALRQLEGHFLPRLFDEVDPRNRTHREVIPLHGDDIVRVGAGRIKHDIGIIVDIDTTIRQRAIFRAADCESRVKDPVFAVTSENIR